MRILDLDSDVYAWTLPIRKKTIYCRRPECGEYMANIRFSSQISTGPYSDFIMLLTTVKANPAL